MSTTTSPLVEKVIVELRDLPDERIAEVLDFVGYLKAKQQREGQEGQTMPPAFRDLVTMLPETSYQLRKPIPVAVRQEKEHYLVTDDAFLRYGIGSSIAEAKEDYACALLDYFDSLSQYEDQLAPRLAQDLARLREFIDIKG